MNEQNLFVSVEDQKKLAPETQEQDKVVDFPQANDVPTISEVIEAQAEAERFTFPDGVMNVIRDTLQKQFSNGLKVGTNAITAVVYGKIGNGKVNFNELEKEELVDILEGVAGFCETGLSQDFLKLLDEDQKNNLKEEQEQSE